MKATLRRRSHPGEILNEGFLEPIGMTQLELSQKMGIYAQQVNLLIKGKRGVTARTAIMLAKVFDTTPYFWMDLQVEYDLWRERIKGSR